MMSKPLFFVSVLLLCHFKGYCRSFFVVRHAEKNTSIADNPQLTELGEARAKRLRGILAYREIQGIFSAETTRTKHTVLPLAERLAIPIQIYDPNNQTRLIDSLKGINSNVVIVGHSNTIHHVINGLAEKTVLEGPLDESIYNRLYEVKRRKIGKPEVKVYEF